MDGDPLPGQDSDRNESPLAVIAMAIVCAALGALLVLGLAGGGGLERETSASPGVALSLQEVVGTWREEQVGAVALVRFGGDGTFAIDTGKLDVPYYAAGTYELEGDTITFESNGPDCASPWRWKVDVVRDRVRPEELHVVFLDAWCMQLRGEAHTFTRP